jgi:hypothetical protein
VKTLNSSEGITTYLNFSAATASAYLRAWHYLQGVECPETLKGASYDECSNPLKCNPTVSLESWLAEALEFWLSNWGLSRCPSWRTKSPCNNRYVTNASHVETFTDRTGSGNGSGRSVPQTLKEALCEACNTNVASKVAMIVVLTPANFFGMCRPDRVCTPTPTNVVSALNLLI